MARPNLSFQFLESNIPFLGNKKIFKNLPERVIQFGTGMLLRALPDFLIHQANLSGIFNGQIVAVKSTSSETDLFQNQDCLYTVLQKGQASEKSHTKTIVTSISRVLAAQTQWAQILECARNPQIDIVLSNTTEAGLTDQPESFTPNEAPVSFPGKLAVYLLERFRNLGYDRSGMVILPCELVIHNAQVLQNLVLKHLPRLLAQYPDTHPSFQEWLISQNYWCSTLVDRIVPGPSEPDHVINLGNLTYTDFLHTAAEPYLLWAIEGNEVIKSKLTFVQADKRIIITESIEPYRERKLRILNGSNTHVAGLGYLAGCNSTFDTMNDPLVSRYVHDLIRREIVPTINKLVPDAEPFAQETMERFRNPEIRYPLLQIALQYTSKMNARNVETFFRYYQQTHQLPVLSCLGLAAYFVFQTPHEKSDGHFLGRRGDEPYSYRDDHAQLTCGLLLNCSTSSEFKTAISQILKNNTIFTRDLTTIPGLMDLVLEQLMDIREKGMRAVLEKTLSNFN